VKITSTFQYVFAAAVFVSPSILVAERIGRSIATDNGEAIYLSEFESNWEDILDQQKKSAGDATSEWKTTNKKLLLDQMIDEKLMLQEARRQKIVVSKR
jgi:hypothetical protein